MSFLISHKLIIVCVEGTVGSDRRLWLSLARSLILESGPVSEWLLVLACHECGLWWCGDRVHRLPFSRPALFVKSITRLGENRKLETQSMLVVGGSKPWSVPLAVLVIRSLLFTVIP